MRHGQKGNFNNTLKWKQLKDAADILWQEESEKQKQAHRRVWIDWFCYGCGFAFTCRNSTTSFTSPPLSDSFLHRMKISKKSKLCRIIQRRRAELRTSGDKGIKWDEDLRRKAWAPCRVLMNFTVGSAAPVNVVCCDWIQDNNQLSPRMLMKPCRGQRSAESVCCYGQISKWGTAVNPVDSRSTHSIQGWQWTCAPINKTLSSQEMQSALAASLCHRHSCWCDHKHSKVCMQKVFAPVRSL